MIRIKGLMMTGDPKGVVLTNANIYQAVISNGLGVTEGFTGEEEWKFLAFMPLSHMYVIFPYRHKGYR